MTSPKPPNRELKRFAVRIGVGVDRYRAELGTDALFSVWEAPRHAWSLNNLALQQVTAIVKIVQEDVRLVSAGWVMARAAVEAAARCIWLMEPDSSWEREARWIAFLFEGARLGRQKDFAGNDRLESESEAIQNFAKAVEEKLPAHVIVPPRIPAISSILRDQNPELSRFYAIASQYTHGAEMATRGTRRNFGVDAEYGDFSDSNSWHWPLWVAWLAYRVTAVALMVERGFTLSGDMLQLVDRQVEEARKSYLEKFHL